MNYIQPCAGHSCCRLVLVACLILAVAPAADPSASGIAQDVNSDDGDVRQERIYSGPQPGEEIKPFRVVHIKDNETLELEIEPDDDEGVTLICFVHRLSNDDRILFGLGLVDFYTLRHKDLTSHYVLLSDDREKILKMLQGWSRGSIFNKSLLSVSVDGVEGPGAYGLNRHVAMTVIVAKGNKVVENLVFKAPNNYDLEKIMAAVARSLGKAEPDLATVQRELRAERQQQAEKRMKSSPVFKLAPDETLGRIMFAMVNARGNRSRIAQRQSQQLAEWVGDSAERGSMLKEYCNALLAGDFQLDRYSQAALEKLVAD